MDLVHGAPDTEAPAAGSSGYVGASAAGTSAAVALAAGASAADVSTTDSHEARKSPERLQR